MTKEELKDKYGAFIAEISEIMGLGKPIDILKLCATTDLFFQPLKKRIEELEQQIEKMKWHDLEKDSNDLPENKRNVWCDYGGGYGVGYYDKDDGGWWIEGHIYCSVIDAWCELPKRDKGDKRK